MERVLLEASEANSIFQSANASPQAKGSKEAYEARQHFSKGAFPELRAACVRYGGRTTRDLLELERGIDNFASRFERGTPSALTGVAPLTGLHAGFLEQLDLIRAKADYLHGKAVAEMERANAVIAETDTSER
jgi:hypothetical protein